MSINVIAAIVAIDSEHEPKDQRDEGVEMSELTERTAIITREGPAESTDQLELLRAAWAADIETLETMSKEIGTLRRRWREALQQLDILIQRNVYLETSGSEKDAAIAAKDAHLIAKDARIVALESELAAVLAKDARIAALEFQLAALQAKGAT